MGYHHLPPPREVVGRESDAVRGAAGLVPGTGVPGEEAPEAWVASVGTAVFGPTRMHVCVRGCRTPHQEGLQPPGFLGVLLSGFRAVSPSRSVTRPVPTEAVSIRRGRFPRLDSHMVSVRTSLSRLTSIREPKTEDNVIVKRIKPLNAYTITVPIHVHAI